MRTVSLRKLGNAVVRCGVPIISVALIAAAQQTSNSAAPQVNSSGTTAGAAQVPPLIQFANIATAGGSALTGEMEITFSLYNAAEGGTALWAETQNVTLDNSGHYSVYVGITKANGVPLSLFSSGEAHWLGVQIAGQAEQPRVFLVSVPYAMKAGDAATIGGLPPSAFMMAKPATSGTTVSAPSGQGSKNQAQAPTESQNFIPIFTNGSGALGNSIMFQSGTTAVGIGTTTPGATLEVNGTSKFDSLATFAKGQTFPGTLTGVTAGTGINVTGSKTSPTIGINTTFANQFYPQLNAANIFTKNQTVNGTMTATTFSGNGAALTNVNAALLNGFSSSAFSQSGLSNTYQSSPPGTAIPQVLGSVTNATNSAGANSNPLDLAASTFNSTAKAAQKETFRWQAEPVGNNTSTPAGKLDLLFGANGAAPTETGLSLANNGQLTFAPGQTFPGAGAGTVTSVGSGAGLTGGPITGSGSLSVATGGVTNAMLANPSLTVAAGTDLTGGGAVALGGTTTVNLDTTKVPQLSTANTFTGNQTITGNLSATGSISAQTAGFSTGSSSPVLNVTETETGAGVAVNATASSNGYGVAGSAGVGVFGVGTALGGSGVLGWGQGDLTNGVEGDAFGTAGIGVRGSASGSQGSGIYGLWSTGSTVGQGSTQAGVWGDSSSGFGVLGTTDGINAGVTGQSDAGSGVFGVSNTFMGVYGQSNNNRGLFGISTSYVGAQGQLGSGSKIGIGFSNIGSWGDAGGSGVIGVAGTADDGNAIFGKNNTVNNETLYVENDSGFANGKTPLAARFAGPGASTYCYIARDGNDNGTGDLICTGSKSAAVPVDGNRMVRLYAVEAADNWFEDAGTGQLTNGSVFVDLDRIFAQTVGGDLDYRVFLTPNGECESLYVASKTSRGFEVREMHGGHSNVAFDYRIMAKRKGYEHVRMEDVTADFARMKQESDILAARQEAGKAAEKNRPPRPMLPKKTTLTPGSAAMHAPILPPRIANPAAKAK